MEVKNKRKPRLNAQQRKLLQLVSDEDLTPEELLNKCGIPGHVLNAWLQKKGFWAEVRRTIGSLRRRRKLDICIDAKIGSRGLGHQIKYSHDLHVRRLGSVNGVSLDMQQEEVDRKKAPKRKTSATEPSRQEFPPDLDPAEAERLLRELQNGAPTSLDEAPSEENLN